MRLTYTGILDRIVTIATSEELSYVYLLSIICFCCYSVVTRTCGDCLGRDTYKGIPGVIDIILASFSTYFRQFCRYFRRSANGSSDIVTAIRLINNDIVGGVLTIDVQECTAFNVCLTCTAIDIVHVAGIDVDLSHAACITGITASVYVTTNSNLCLHQCCRQTK